MIIVQSVLEGEKQLLHEADRIATGSPRAVLRGLETSARGIFDESFKRLTGPGRPSVRLRNTRAEFHAARGIVRSGRTRLRGQSSMLGARPGSYPVPTVTGNLRNHLDWLGPGETKRGEAGSITAGQNEFILFNSAAYARVIHDPKPGESSHRYGRRPFLDDGVKDYGFGRIRQNIEAEVAREAG